jgi:hypothetical protein
VRRRRCCPSAVQSPARRASRAHGRKTRANTSAHTRAHCGVSNTHTPTRAHAHTHTHTHTRTHTRTRTRTRTRAHTHTRTHTHTHTHTPLGSLLSVLWRFRLERGWIPGSAAYGKHERKEPGIAVRRLRRIRVRIIRRIRVRRIGRIRVRIIRRIRVRRIGRIRVRRIGRIRVRVIRKVTVWVIRRTSGSERKFESGLAALLRRRACGLHFDRELCGPLRVERSLPAQHCRHNKHYRHYRHYRQYRRCKRPPAAPTAAHDCRGPCSGHYRLPRPARAGGGLPGAVPPTCSESSRAGGRTLRARRRPAVGVGPTARARSVTGPMRVRR